MKWPIHVLTTAKQPRKLYKESPNEVVVDVEVGEETVSLRIPSSLRIIILLAQTVTAQTAVVVLGNARALVVARPMSM